MFSLPPQVQRLRFTPCNCNFDWICIAKQKACVHLWKPPQLHSPDARSGYNGIVSGPDYFCALFTSAFVVLLVKAVWCRVRIRLQRGLFWSRSVAWQARTDNRSMDGKCFHRVWLFESGRPLCLWAQFTLLDGVPRSSLGAKTQRNVFRTVTSMHGQIYTQLFWHLILYLIIILIDSYIVRKYKYLVQICSLQLTQISILSSPYIFKTGSLFQI